MSASVGPRAVRSRGKSALRLGSSLVTLAGLAVTSPALGATTVAGGSTPVSTATAAAGSPDDISQTGTLGVTSGAAITLNSSNSVTNAGTIQAQNVSGVAGILADTGSSGPRTGSITNSGTITYNESATLTTTDSAGDLIGPFATGSNRYGIRVVGAGGLTGDITNSGTITIQGEPNSAGVSVEAPLTGSIVSTGTITASGSGVVAIGTSSTVGGNVAMSGALTASGAGARGVVIGGDVGGGLIVESSVTVTGYHQTTRSTTSSVLADEVANDSAQSGAAIDVGGSLGRGLLISAPPGVLPTDTTADTDGDGLADSTEPTAVVTSYGGAPALQLGAVGKDIALGVAGTGDSAYGLVIGGTLQGLALRDGTPAQGLQIGVPGGGAVTIDSGVRVRGSVLATAYGGDAVAMHLNSGASTPVLYNSGTIAATMTGDGAQTARALVIETGASLPSIINVGAIRGQVLGLTGAATTIVDRSGTVSSIQNIGTIEALTGLPAGSTETGTPSGAKVAIDASNNTTGFSLLSYQPTGWSITPAITGSVLMGSGNDTVDIEAGSLTGDLWFGAGANTLTVNGGATVVGALTANGGTLALTVGSGTLQIDNTAQLNLTGLHLGAASKVVFTADPASGAATQFNVAGPAVIDAGAKIDLRLTSVAQGSATYTLIRASQLTASGVVDSNLLGTTPYIYTSQLTADPGAGTVSVTLARKTAAELGLSAATAGGYEPVIAGVSANAALSTGLLAQTTRKDLLSAYNQLLPEHSGGVFRMVQAGVQAFGRPVDERTGDDGGVWLQEVNFVADADDRDDQLGYHGWGFGLVGGYEFSALNIGSFGLTFGGLTTETRPHDTPATSQVTANVLDAGAYWRLEQGPFTASVRTAVDYLSATDRRAVELAGDDGTIFAGQASGHWSGWGLTSRARISYERRWRSMYFKPQLGFDFLQLHEDGYQEGGGGDLDLTVGSRKTSELSGYAGVAVGAVFGDAATAYWSPELQLGYRNVLSSSGGATAAAFTSGGDTFVVGPLETGDGGAVARLAIRTGSAATTFSFEGGAETRDHLAVFDAKLSAVFRF